MSFRALPVYLFLFFCLQTEGQQGDKMRKTRSDGLLLSDSVVKRIRKQLDTLPAVRMQAPDSAFYKPRFDPEPLLQLQREQKARQRSAAITRIAFGAALLALLVLGWLRREKIRNRK